MYSEVPVVLKRDVAHEERVLVDAEQQDAQRRQIGAIEQRDYENNTGDIARRSPQLLLYVVRPVRRQISHAPVGVRGNDVEHPGRRGLGHPEERRVVVLQLATKPQKTRT